ncbi:hypothetical protein M9H77_30975 [Catharanthus roseus]|uniref:Uncharacterized protein n=1 Tax=Catharanthus roseus TaxID=4058 RepID=A0ACB9ZYQ4_CATRO|nr:hypothetical protein M9H77_30975 [Catharanthus roseus]
MQTRKMLFVAILSICASSLKKISIYNEEMIKSLGKTFKVTLFRRIQAIREESQQFFNPNESTTLPNATFSRRIRLQDDLFMVFHFSVSERFEPESMLKASVVELIREGLVVLRMVCWNP